MLTIRTEQPIHEMTAQDIGRLTMRGVLVHRATKCAAWLVATNGHAMACVPADCGGDHPDAVIPADIMQHGRVQPTNRTGHVDIDGKVTAYGRKNTEKSDIPIEGDFPHFQPVIPEAEDGEVVWVHLNADLLAKLARSITKDGCVRIGVPRYPHNGGKRNKPLMVLPLDCAASDVSEDNRGAFGVLMVIAGIENVDTADTKEWNDRTKMLKADFAPKP